MIHIFWNLEMKNLIVHKQKPFNAEPNLIHLRENYITPNNSWFIRNHHPIPNIDINNYCLSLKNDNNLEIKLDYHELIEYPEINIISTIQCAGNRRKEFNNIETTLGLAGTVEQFLMLNGVVSLLKLF